ncbi:MAG: helix-turn-helix transcriptional regulator [Erysipelotrichales bacterium]|nr:helix-turn-helix transcriptional regulator [Erysipelotrichales bacterium]
MNLKRTGKLIADARAGKGYTQQELADRLHVSNSAVSRWENGDRFPDVSLLEPISKELDIPLSSLISGEEPDDQTVLSDLLEATKDEIRKKENRNLKYIIGLSVIVLGLAAVLLVYVFNNSFPSAYDGTWYSTSGRVMKFTRGTIYDTWAKKDVGKYTETSDFIQMNPTWDEPGTNLYYYQFPGGAEILSNQPDGFGKVFFVKGGSDSVNSLNKAYCAKKDRFIKYLHKVFPGKWTPYLEENRALYPDISVESTDRNTWNLALLDESGGISEDYGECGCIGYDGMNPFEGHLISMTMHFCYPDPENPQNFHHIQVAETLKTYSDQIITIFGIDYRKVED